MIELNMSLDAANFILQVLGQLPTSSNAYPLLVHLKEQVERQLKEKESANGENASVAA